MKASAVEFIFELVCFVAVIALFGFIFKRIDLRIRIDIKSTQMQNKHVNKQD